MQIAAIQPRVVISFGSWADQFFRYLDASGTRVPVPRLWKYISDRLSPEGRALAEKMIVPTATPRHLAAFSTRKPVTGAGLFTKDSYAAKSYSVVTPAR